MDERINDTQAAEFWKRRLMEHVDHTRSNDEADGFQVVMNIERRLAKGGYDDELMYY